jgi:hypothetical protein
LGRGLRFECGKIEMLEASESFDVRDEPLQNLDDP